MKVLKQQGILYVPGKERRCGEVGVPMVRILTELKPPDDITGLFWALVPGLKTLFAMLTLNMSSSSLDLSVSICTMRL